MSNDVAKLNLQAWMLPPAGAVVSKLNAHAWLAPDDMAVAKVGLHAWLMPMTVGVAKLNLHAWLVPDLPDLPPYAVDLVFEGGGGLAVAGATLIFLGEAAFAGEGRVTFAPAFDPPFACAPALQTPWSGGGADVAATAFVRAEAEAAGWRCADGRAVAAIDRLADVAGDLLVYVNADRIRLI